jgi:hypothetical protein
MKFSPKDPYDHANRGKYKKPPEINALFSAAIRKIAAKLAEDRDNATKKMLVDLGWTPPPAEEEPETLLCIGGISDGRTVTFPNDDYVMKSAIPPECPAVFSTSGFDEPFTCKTDTYNRLTIGGVDVWAVEGMTKSDVAHMLISNYLKHASDN